MYGIHLPPEQLRRLHYLRTHHDLGSVKFQVVNAVENYLEAKEKEHGLSTDHRSPKAPGADPPRRCDRHGR